MNGTIEKNDTFNIYKTDNDKRLVFGWASISITVDGEQLIDRQQDMIDPEDLEEAAYEYVLNYRDTGEEHISTMRMRGKLVESCVLTAEKQKAMGIPEGTLPIGWWVGFKITDDAAWERVKNGTYRMFSIEGKASREPIEKSYKDENIVKSTERFDYIVETPQRVAKTFDEVIEKFNPFHDKLGRFSNKNGFSTYSANPKTKAGAMAIQRSAVYGHGKTLNVHRESKGENINQNYDWMQGKPYGKPAAPATPKTTPQTPKQTPPKQQPTQPPKQQPSKPNTGGSVKDGVANNAVDGKDLSGKFTFDKNSSDYSIEQVIKAQGFDGKPTVTNNAADFAEACKASNFIAKRGIGATDQATMNQYDNDLKNGKFYVQCGGGNVHGYGMYAASVEANGRNARSGVAHAQSTADAYASGSRVTKTYTMTLDKSAKIGNETDLSNQMARDKTYQNMCQKSGMNSSYTYDVGCYAVYKGFDAYVAYSKRMSTTGATSDYTVILNRSKVIILDD